MSNIQDTLERLHHHLVTRKTTTSLNLSREKPEYFCPKCKDEMVIVDLTKNAAAQCDCINRRRVNRVLKHSHISDEFRSKTFENFDLEGKDQRIVRAYRLAKGYAEKFDEVRKSSKNGFGIAGAVGIGKTHLLCAIANTLLERGIAVRYFNFVTGFKEMFAQYDKGGEAVEAIRWELMTCEVLMFDDLVKGKVNWKTKTVDIKQSVYDETYAIIDYRYENHLPIIWSSELYGGLAQDGVLGEATATRLFEKSHIANVMYRNGEAKGSLNHRLRGFKEVAE